MDESPFDAWVRSAAPRLHRTAFLLVGDWTLAQDLVQSACASVWSRFDKVDSPDAYARVVMVRTATAWWRRKWRFEVPTSDVPEATAEDISTDAARRADLFRALSSLPPRQRAVVVLRFYEDLSEADTAALLDWPVGTVKSTAARALSALRLMDLEQEEAR